MSVPAPEVEQIEEPSLPENVSEILEQVGRTRIKWKWVGAAFALILLLLVFAGSSAFLKGFAHGVNSDTNILSTPTIAAAANADGELNTAKMQEELPMPSEVLHDFREFCKSKDYVRAYALLSTENQSRHLYSKFAKGFEKTVSEEYEILNVDEPVARPWTQGQSVNGRVLVNATENNDTGTIVRTLTIDYELVFEANGWRIQRGKVVDSLIHANQAAPVMPDAESHQPVMPHAQPHRPLMTWPTGLNGYTVLATGLPIADGFESARSIADNVATVGAGEVGILESSNYANLHRGDYLIIAGMYFEPSKAIAALSRFSLNVYPNAAVFRIADGNFMRYNPPPTANPNRNEPTPAEFLKQFGQTVQDIQKNQNK